MKIRSLIESSKPEFKIVKGVTEDLLKNRASAMVLMAQSEVLKNDTHSWIMEMLHYKFDVLGYKSSPEAMVFVLFYWWKNGEIARDNLKISYYAELRRDTNNQRDDLHLKFHDVVTDVNREIKRVSSKSNAVDGPRIFELHVLDMNDALL